MGTSVGWAVSVGMLVGADVFVATAVLVGGGTGVEVGNGISVGAGAPPPVFGTNRPGMQLAVLPVDRTSEFGCHRPLPSSTHAPLYRCWPTEHSGVNTLEWGPAEQHWRLASY